MSIVLGAPDDSDDPVGIVLARMRRTKRITGAQLAARVGMSQPKISRIERGRTLPEPEDVGVIARALGADEARVQALMNRVERLHDRMTDWRPASATLVGRQKDVMGWEAAATVLRDFEPAMVPGLLQTSGYAAAAFRVFQRVAPLVDGELTETAVLAAVSARARRQEILADQSKSFYFIVTEVALRNPICSPAEMLAQISHLREVAGRRANLSVAVVRDDAPVGFPPMHGFVLHDDNLVIIDVYNTGLLSRSHKDVEGYHRVFRIFEEHATDIGPILDKYQALYIEQLRK